MATPRVGQFHPERVQGRVADMGINDASMYLGGLICMHLGAVAALDADGILNDQLMVNGSAVTVTSFLTRELPGRFGRNVTAVASSTNTRAMTVTGKDYKGNKMVETITLTSGTTVEGKKAFKWIDQIVFASASDTTTVDVGWGNVLGLPYKTTAGVTEIIDGVANVNSFEKVWQSIYIPATPLLAGTSQWIVSPIRGYVTDFKTIVNVDVGTGGTLTVELGGVAVAGLNSVVPNSATAGSVVSDSVAFGLATGLVAENGAIEIVGDANFATTGELTAVVGITPANLVPGDATTATSTTGDVRGTYRPTTTPDGVVVFSILAFVDTTQLDGIAQYAG